MPIEVDTVEIARATAPANSLTVHASAGTGKTWLLTSRILRLLLTGTEPASILAITFTRKAAAEIQQRVIERAFEMTAASDEQLGAALRAIGADDDAEQRARARTLYERLLMSLRELRATTFHAFCQELLKRFPLEAGVAPGFELVEATAELRVLAWRRLQSDLRREPEGEIATAMMQLFDACGTLFNTRQILDTFLDRRSDWWAYTEDLDDPVGDSLRRLQQQLELDGPDDPTPRLLHDELLHARLATYAALLQRHPIDTNLAQLERIARARSADTDSDTAFADLWTTFFTGKDEPRALKRTKTLEQKVGADDCTRLLQLHADLQAALAAMREQRLRHRTLVVSAAWYRCGARLLHHYQRVKSAQNVLDFADLEWLCYRLLTTGEHAQWIQYKLDQRIDHLLVDEFQDTNPTQWRLLLPLLEEIAAGAGERPRSVFLVGDDKQSIYRFRRADPRLFEYARRWLAQHMRSGSLTQHISWRSSPAIIHFVNLVFADLATDAGTDVPATHTPLPDYPLHDTHRRALAGCVELLPLIPAVLRHSGGEAAADDGGALRDSLIVPRVPPEDLRYRTEAAQVAATIEAIIGQPVHDGGRERPLHYGDIMVLLRDRRHAEAYERALREAGVPYSGAGRGTFLECRETKDLIALLRCLTLPYDDLSLASVLRSPMFDCPHASLERIAACDDGLPWFLRLTESLDTGEDTHLQRARRLLLDWRALTDRIPVHDLLDKVYTQANVIDRYVSAAPGHLKSRVEANLIRFLELALDVDSGRYPSLNRFLAWLDQMASAGSEAPAEAPAPATERVRVMTIHAAKGLEAPVVFLVDAARDKSTAVSGNDALVDWPADEERPRHFHLIANTGERDALSRRLLEEQARGAAREETNLLYVALTRARQRLYISGSESAKANSRGWYGFIEQRLRLAETEGRAPPPGLIVEHVAGDDGVTINTLCRLTHGPADAQITTPHAAPATDSIAPDPALTRPLPAGESAAALYPSLERDDGPASTTPEDAQPLNDSARRRGIVIHRILERLSAGADAHTQKQRLQEEFADSLEPARFERYWQEANAVYHAPEFTDLFDPTRYREARNEQPLLYRHGERSVYGIIDRLIVRENDILLVDYKTHRHARAGNVQTLAGQYREQMRLYTEGAARLWPGKPVKALLVFTACRLSVDATPERPD